MNEQFQDKIQLKQGLRILITSLCLVIILFGLNYFIYNFKKSGKIRDYVQSGRVITENLAIPDLVETKLQDGRAISAGEIITPLSQKNSEDKILVPLAKVKIKEAYELGNQQARTWSEDARLLYIKSFGAIQLDGRSSQWLLVFGSVQKGNGYEVLIRGSEIILNKEAAVDSPGKDLPENWFNSDEALRIVASMPELKDLGFSALSLYFNADATAWHYGVALSDGRTISLPVR